LKVAHTLDLRRIPSFDMQRIRREASKLLDVSPNSEVMDVLWEQSGKYLHASGDRDGDSRNHWSDRFFTLQQNPAQLYLELRNHLLPWTSN
jgi:hypothetical protein